MLSYIDQFLWRLVVPAAITSHVAVIIAKLLATLPLFIQRCLQKFTLLSGLIFRARFKLKKPKIRFY